MIYTITFNPAIDYMVSTPDFKLGRTNRTTEESILFGGKGINVSIVLKNLGLESTALGFIAGFTGEEIKKGVERMGCRTDFITLPKGMSRINVKLNSHEGTEINGQGPHIDKESLQKLFLQLDDLQEGDVLVLAGSVPAGIPSTIYKELLDRLSGRGILTVVDAAEELLTDVLPKRPFLIKPNQHELEAIFETEIEKRPDAVCYAKRLQEMGARNVLVSFGGNGALLVTENGEVYESDAPKGTVVNAVGAGDSMVAGFLFGWLADRSYEEAFFTGIAAGSAGAFSGKFATKEEVLGLRKELMKSE